MARLLSRLADFGRTGLPRFAFTWSQRVCEQIESQFSDVLIALASMADIPDVHIAADYTGTPNSGQIPATVQAIRYNGTTDVSSSATWGFTTDNGGITASIDATGILTITAITATTHVTITSTHNGVDKSRTFTVYLDSAAAPSSGTVSGSGTTATDSSLSNISSATHTAISNELSIVIGSNGKATLSSPLTISTAAASPAGTYDVKTIWRHWSGGVWVDMGTETSSNPDCTVTSVHSSYSVTNGTCKNNRSQTGLTPGATEKYQLYGRNASGTRVMTVTGTASAVGS